MEQTETPTKPDNNRLPWPPITAGILVIATYFGAQIVGALCIFAFGFVVSRNADEVERLLSDSTLAQFANSLIVYGLMAYVLYYFARRRGVSLRTFGVVAPRFRDIGVTLLAIVPYIAGYAVLLAAVTALVPSLDVEQKQQLGFQDTQAGLELLLTFISLVVLPPLVEEFVMRGFLFTSLLSRFKFVIAAILTSFIFAAAHLQIGSGAAPLWIAAIDTFILSLILCFMRYKTGSLWPGIFLHALKNGVAFLSIFVFHIT
jgi:uncharacterized protein